MRNDNRDPERRRDRSVRIGCCVPGAVCFFALLFAFCWLCCACSGYHWE